MIPIWLKLLVLGTLVAGLISFGWVGGKANERKAWQLKEAAQVKAQLDDSEHARIVEQALQAKVVEAQRNGQAEKVRSERAAALLRADADRVRSEFAAYISGPANDTITACVERGKATGVVLDAAISVAGAMAEAGEVCEADKRTLIAAWPKP